MRDGVEAERQISYTRVIGEKVVECDPIEPDLYCASIPRRKPNDMALVIEALKSDWKKTVVVAAGTLQRHARFFFDIFLTLCAVEKDIENSKFTKKSFIKYHQANETAENILHVISLFLGNEDLFGNSKSFLKVSLYAAWALGQSHDIAKDVEKNWIENVKLLATSLGSKDTKFLSWSEAHEMAKPDVGHTASNEGVVEYGLIDEMVDSFYQMLISHRRKKPTLADVTEEMEQMLRHSLRRYYQEEIQFLINYSEKKPNFVLAYSFGEHADQQRLFTKLGRQVGFSVYGAEMPVRSGSSTPSRGCSVADTPVLSPNMSPTRAPSSRVPPPDDFKLDSGTPIESDLVLSLRSQVEGLGRDLSALTERYNQLEKSYQSGRTGEQEMLLFSAGEKEKSISESTTCLSFCVVS